MRGALAALTPPNPRHPMPPADPSRPKGLNLLGTFAHHPDLARAYHSYTGHVLFGSTLSPRQRELLVLRVAALRDAEYEWAQHTVLAADAGLSPDEIARVGEGPGADGWDAHDRLLLRAADELIADARVADDTWQELAGQLDEQQLLDVVFTVGCYEVLAMVLRSVDVELDADLIDRK